MKQVLFALLISVVATVVFAQQKGLAKPDPAQKIDTVDAACGQCRFHMKGKGCSLSVRIDGKRYFVDGTDNDSHGDAHADDGFCSKMRKVKMQGNIVDGRFKATYFELLPERRRKS